LLGTGHHRHERADEGLEQKSSGEPRHHAPSHHAPELLFYTFFVPPGRPWYDVMYRNKLCYFQRHNYSTLLEVLPLEPAFSLEFGDQSAVAARGFGVREGRIKGRAGHLWAPATDIVNREQSAS
jgi:hypothetical protein